MDYLTFGTKRGDQVIKRGGNSTKGFEYLTLDAKKAFNFLEYIFSQALIFKHFDLKRHIRIKTNVSGYAIAEIFSHLILYDLN